MANQRKKPVALVDMDGTLSDFHGALARDLRRLMSPGEEEITLGYDYDNRPPYIKARQDLIKSQPNWWFNLEPLVNGFIVLEHLIRLGFKINILTRGPSKNFSAWEQKARWVDNYVPTAKITITTGEKALNYGRVLVDDFPEYIIPWLKVRPRGLVVMPDQPWNADFEHPQVFRYSGREDVELVKLLQYQKDRE